ncbi:serine hydrolase [Maricurvus nonylphenolicus]|uniref:serine hydrolase domain-containing protein n=1 Tax=Maricurvus nonylphenolicus TaxID=1008307 RepID=UPI0036F26218
MTISEVQPEAALKLYAGQPMHDVFPVLKDFLPTKVMTPCIAPSPFPSGDSLSLPEHYEYLSEQKTTEALIKETDTAALLVLKQGKICFEHYYLTGGKDVPWISFSMSKSIVSALVGIALEEGKISSIEDPISDYVPSLKGSAYDGVSILHVLQMSSGARWSEDYSDPNAEVHRFEAVMAGIDTLEEFVSGIERGYEPGKQCRYNSADTMALGLLLIKATGVSISAYMQKHLYNPLRMENAGYWLIDREGTEMAAGGVLMTARDFAKFGELFRNSGVWNGKQIIPAAWVNASTTIQAAHLKPGEVLLGDHKFPLGYGLQWWIPEGDLGEFSAIGVYNQFIYVDPSRDLVIVKLSSNRQYGTTSSESTNKELETLEMLRAIAKATDEK